MKPRRVEELHALQDRQDYKNELASNSDRLDGIEYPPSGGGAGLKNAFAKADASTGATIVCYLGTDETGPEVTVNIEIVGGSNLNDAIPRLENGDRLTVWLDGSTWRCTTIFQATDDC